jgi:hypothetical protein
MTRYLPIAGLVLLGLLQMIGDVVGVPALKGIGAATGASPAPKVFSAVQGLETYSTRFILEWTDTAGAPQTLELTPEVYARLRGPYNRRNAYGAVLAYGPLLASQPRTAPMFRQATSFAACGNAPLLRELGLDPARITGPVAVRLVPKHPERLPQHFPTRFEMACHD